MKKLSDIGGWSGKEVLKGKREWCKANARGAFLQVYNKTSFRADQSQKKHTFLPAQSMMHFSAGLSSRTWPRFDSLLPFPSTGCINATQDHTVFCGDWRLRSVRCFGWSQPRLAKAKGLNWDKRESKCRCFRARVWRSRSRALKNERLGGFIISFQAGKGSEGIVSAHWSMAISQEFC